MPADCASRLRGSPTVRPCTDDDLAGILPAIAVATFPPPARRGREGPGKSQSAAVPAAEALCPSEERRRADGSAACSARGRREGSRRFGCRPWMACQPNPSDRSEPLAQRGARIRGHRFLWLLSFEQAKESNWSPWMATKPHTDVSRSSRPRRTPESESQNGIPACAGTTP